MESRGTIGRACKSVNPPLLTALPVTAGERIVRNFASARETGHRDAVALDAAASLADTEFRRTWNLITNLGMRNGDDGIERACSGST